MMIEQSSFKNFALGGGGGAFGEKLHMAYSISGFGRA